MLEKTVLVPTFLVYCAEKLAASIPSPRGPTEYEISQAVQVAVSLVVGNGH